MKRLLVLLFLTLASTSFGQKLDRNIFIETLVDAPVPKVWDAFTTSEGLETFFAPECHIDLKVDGRLDIFFYPDAPPGQRGAEGMRIMAVEQNRMLSFTWNNLTELPGIGNQRTHVTLKLFPSGPDNSKTRLILIHDGWGDGEVWDQAYQYYTKAWEEIVLFRLHYRFTKGPVDWSNPPVNKRRFNILID